jgi:fructose-bisphosphate aldolase, class I
MNFNEIETLLGRDAEYLLAYRTKVSKELLHTPSPDFIDEIFALTNRNSQVLRSLSAIYNHGRLANTGYVSILPIDQGIEHTAGSAFAANSIYFDPANIIKLAIEGGCNAVATSVK